MTTTKKPTALPVQLGSVPADLRAINRWVCWKYVQRTKPNGEKVWAKLPMTAEGYAASSIKPATWTTFDEAADALILGDFDGIGIVLGDDVQGIDLDDCRDPHTGYLSALATELLEKVEGYAEVSPSGNGIKLFTRTNLDGSRTKKEVGVEMYRDGRYFTVTGHGVNGHAGLPADVQDVSWFVHKVFDEDLSEPVALTGDAAERALALYKPPLEGWDLDRVIDEVLPHLDPDCGYAEWLAIGQALHHQGQGDTEWLEAWDQWSAASGKYAETVCAEKWDSFHGQRASGRGALTLASLLKQTEGQRKQAVRAERDDLLEAFKQAIAVCTDPRDLQDQVAVKIASALELTAVEREILAKAIQLRGKDLGVPSLRITDVRAWLKPRSVEGTAPMPDWAKPWVYVTDGDKFFNTETKQEVTGLGFRSMHNRLMPIDAQGSRERADQWAVEFWDMPVVAHKAYMPGASATFCMFGLEWVNLYRPESVPEVPSVLTAADQAAIETVQQHLVTYLADERERQLLMSWIAWNVQHPGAKVRWAPYVHGVPGDGKSFFSELVGAAMGGQNVRMLNGSTLESNFTDWATGYALVAIEEMKQHGHNKFDIMNRLKPYITNSQIEIHPKGKASYTAPNVSNYIIFSNYLDGAPVDANDRRYMFLSSRLTAAEAQKLTQGGYFKRLFDAVHDHAGAIRQWLLEFQLHPEFDANGRAPDTETKKTVVELSKSDIEMAAEDLIERGDVGITAGVISSAHFTKALVAAGHDGPASTRLNGLLTRLGFRFAGRRRALGTWCRIWVHESSAVDILEAVTRLNRTADAAEDFLQ
jgi:primase-polymerase (primpol)-like protein